MIGRVYRGGDVGGLARYLWGPGRHNEHENPHLVAAWDLQTPAELATLEPAIVSGNGAHAVRDFRAFVASMELATALRPAAVNDRMVWHCALRTAPGDRTLSDAEWAEVARDVMNRTGIARTDDPGGCRWFAIRHDEPSIHLVAVLARQDGKAARTDNDFRRLREACQAAETKYGLQSTAPADLTAARHTTRAETERTTRTGFPLPARDWLRAEVQHAAAASRSPAEFLDRLRAAGVEVRERRDSNGNGHLSGYAVARPEPGQISIFFGGGKLAADLSLPRLSARWHSTSEAHDQQLVSDPGDRHAVWVKATDAAARAAETVRLHGAQDPDTAGDCAAAAAEVLAAASRLVEGPRGGPLSQAARDYDRAARETYGRIARPSEAGTMLRAAALAMTRAAGHSPRQAEAARVALLIAQITSLSLAIARLRENQNRTAQAQAARRAATHLNTATDQWSDTAEAHITVQHHRPNQQDVGSAQTTTVPTRTPRTRPAGAANPRPPMPNSPSTGGRTR